MLFSKLLINGGTLSDRNTSPRLLLRDGIILAMEATEVAAKSAQGEDQFAGFIMVERFFFDWVDGNGTGLAVVFRIKIATVVGARPAGTGLAFPNQAILRAEAAADPVSL